MKKKIAVLLSILGPGIANAELVGHWDFEGDFEDRSPNGNDGEAMGAIIDSDTAAVGDQSANFAEGDHILINEAGGGLQINQMENFSISFWVNTDQVQDDRRFFSESSTTSNAPLYNIGTGSPGNGTNQIDFFRRDDASVFSNNHNLTTATPLGDGMWHHVAVVDTSGETATDTRTVEIYIDGVLDTTTSYAPSALTTDVTSLGAILRGSVTSGIIGNMDEVAIYNEGLNQIQIQALNNQVNPALVSASIDSDNDDLPDYFEIVFGLNEMDNGSGNPRNGPNGDPDMDTLNNLREFQALTNPTNADTDMDDVTDAVEIDVDMTDPLVADADNDGLNDGAEKLAGTMPTVADTDMDELLDGFEVENGLSPLDNGSIDPNNGATGDPDNDLLENLAEQTAGTRANMEDTDSDNLLDGAEVNTFNTDPNLPDTDTDGINDDEEVVIGSDGFVTNPLEIDTDFDGINDLDEINDGSDPTDVNDPNALPTIPTEGLIHLWTFDEMSGTVANDSVGAINGTWNGDAANITWTTEGLVGGAADLAGQNTGGNHFNLDQLAIEGLTQMTVSIWFQNDGNTDNAYNSLIMSRPANWGIAIENNNQQADFRFNNEADGSSRGFDSAAVLTASATEWHHAIMSIDTDSGEIIYTLDGVSVSANHSGASAISGIGWAIGNDGSAGTSRDWDGRLDELAIWNIALTADDHQAVYRNGLSGIGVTPSTEERIMINDISIDSEDRVVIEFASTPDARYEVRATRDLSLAFDDWEIGIDDDIPADGESTTVSTQPNFTTMAGNERIFFAVRVME